MKEKQARDRSARNYVHTAADVRVFDFYMLAVLKVNAIGIWAVLGRGNGDVANLDPSGIIELQMAERTIDNADATDHHVTA